MLSGYGKKIQGGNERLAEHNRCGRRQSKNGSEVRGGKSLLPEEGGEKSSEGENLGGGDSKEVRQKGCSFSWKKERFRVCLVALAALSGCSPRSSRGLCAELKL